MLSENRRRSDSIALPKRQLIAAWRLSGDGLALSVTAERRATSPKGRGFGLREKYDLLRKYE